MIIKQILDRYPDGQIFKVSKDEVNNRQVGMAVYVKFKTVHE